MISIKSKQEIDKMREVCKLTAKLYEYLETKIVPGISTFELDRLAHEYILKLGAKPAQINYDPHIRGVMPYPSATCISLNDCIIHGIPSKKDILKQGDIVSIDTVLEKNGFHGDAARTFIVGKENNAEDRKLVEVTKAAFYEGLKYAKPGNRIGDISNAIEQFVKKNGFNVIHEFMGHGIGKSMHEEPGIPNYGKPGHGPRLQEGMTICIEPMVCSGSRNIYELDDGWSIMMDDEKNAAHYENTILITKNANEILTVC